MLKLDVAPRELLKKDVELNGVAKSNGPSNTTYSNRTPANLLGPT